MKIVSVTDNPRDRDAERTREHLHRLGIPYATAPIPTTVRVTNGDRELTWNGYQPHRINKNCRLGGL